MDYNEKIRDIIGDDSVDIRYLLSRNMGHLDYQIMNGLEIKSLQKKREPKHD